MANWGGRGSNQGPNSFYSAPGWQQQWQQNNAALPPNYGQIVPDQSGDYTTPVGQRIVDTTSGLYPSDFAVARASVASYWDYDGVLKYKNANEARLDYLYNGTSWILGGLLVEPSVTSEIVRRDLTVSGVWNTFDSGAVTVGAAQTALDGSLNAYPLTIANTALRHAFYSSGWTKVTTNSYNFSAIVKPLSTYTKISIGDVNANNLAVFDTASGGSVITTYPNTGWTITNAKIENVDNTGNFRISCTITPPSSATLDFGFVFVDNAWTTASGNPESYNWTGNGLASWLVQELQWENSSVPTSFIPNSTTAPVTRAADDYTFTLRSGVTQLTFTFDDASTQTVTGLTGGTTYHIPTTLNRSRILYIDDNFSIANVGSASGSGSATGIGNAIANSDGAASGTGAATGIGASTAASNGAASGAGAASAVGIALVTAIGSASGAGAATAIGASTAVSPGSASGSGTATAVGASTAASPGSSAGSGSATAVGASTAASAGSASGVGAATGVGLAIKAAVGSAAGSGAATAVGASTAASAGSASGAGTAAATAGLTGSAAGVGAATAVGTSTAAATGSAAGSGAASAVGKATAASAGSSAGSGTALAVGASTAAAAGSSTASGSGTAVGASTAAGTGTAAGSGAAIAVGAATARSVGASSGAGAATAVGASGTIGLAAGSGAATAVGRSTAAATGTAAGSGSATGIASSAATSAAGSAAGAGSASGIGASVVAAIGSAAGSSTAAAIGTGAALNIVSAVGAASGAGAAFGTGAATAIASTPKRIWQVVKETLPITEGAFDNGFSDGFGIDHAGAQPPPLWHVTRGGPAATPVWRVVKETLPIVAGAFDDGFSDGFDIDRAGVQRPPVWKKAA